VTLVVAGGSIAALVAADAAAAAGTPVELLLPRRGVGGGFAPLPLDGRRLERGLRALELRYEGTGTPPPLGEYDPAGPGHRPFTRRIEAWVRALVGDDLVELDRPRMWLAGRMDDELLVTCDLTRLPAYLDAPTLAAIRAQTADGGSGLLGAGATPGSEWTTAFATASAAQHGIAFHDLVIAAFAQKLRPAGGADVPVALRRKLWLPLFHPHTLWEAASGRPVSFRPERPLHTVADGGTGVIVDRLLQRLEAAPQVSVRSIDGVQAIRPEGGDVRLVLHGGDEVLAHEPILALSAGELFSAAEVQYVPDRVGSVMAWVDVKEADVISLPSFVHVVDADVPVFRLSRGERHDGRVVVCVECAHDVAKEAAPAVAAAALERLGVVREGASMTSLAAFAGPTFTAPTFANVARFAAARDAYDERRIRARTIGGSEAFGADAFNEQVIQGLAAAEAWAADHGLQARQRAA
jgi:hypothetical protein